MAVTEYGTIGIRPMGTYDSDIKYDLLNLVEFDGSSYVAYTDPPLGSLPTNTAYWQVSAQGTGRATADSVGTVKPDGVTTEVSADGSLSVKTATQGGLGVVKGSNGIKVGDDGSIDINTVFSQATELANIIAGEAISLALGKMAKSIAVTMGLNENALLKSMLTNMDVNDSTKVNSATYVHKLTERIGMGEELSAGANLTAGLNALNSNLMSNTVIIAPPPGLSFGTVTDYKYKIHRFGKIGILDISIVELNIVKDHDYTIGVLGGYIVSFTAPLSAAAFNLIKPPSELRCINGILHIIAGQDDAAVQVSGMIPFMIL